jgi:hypothetical protein
MFIAKAEANHYDNSATPKRQSKSISIQHLKTTASSYNYYSITGLNSSILLEEAPISLAGLHLLMTTPVSHLARMRKLMS